MIDLGGLATMLEKRYEISKEQVLLDLIKVEQRVHSKIITENKLPYRFDRCYFFLASGYLSNEYKKQGAKWEEQYYKDLKR